MHAGAVPEASTLLVLPLVLRQKAIGGFRINCDLRRAPPRIFALALQRTAGGRFGLRRSDGLSVAATLRIAGRPRGDQDEHRNSWLAMD